MSKLYYNPIELPELPSEKKTSDPTVEKWPTVEQFALVNDRVAKELNGIQNGSSDLVHVARYFHGKEPVMMKFNQFRQDPTKRNWVDFMLLVEQDIGRKAADQFEKWYHLIFTGTVTYKEN
jgi:hypothetical protein